MKVVKCSPSAINTYKHCPFSYFLGYILGMESRVGKAALQGSIAHQVFEWMALIRKYRKYQVDPHYLLDKAWAIHIKRNPGIEIRKQTTKIDKETGDFKEAADFRKCREAIETVIDDQFYNPYGVNVIDAEKWFALEMPGEEWSCVDEYGNKHQFAVRGLIDLIHEIDKDTIEIVDWKTGSKSDFHTKQEITDTILMREVQPRIYHLAAFLLYPQYKNVLVTFYYTGDGGPITIALSPEDISMTIAALYRFFREIKQDTLIRRNRHWTCKMCSFERSGICSKVWGDLHTMGNEYVEDQYAKLTFEQQKEI